MNRPDAKPHLEPHLNRLFRLIQATPELDWLILTKRPEFARDWLACWTPQPEPNVWLGVSIENSRFTWRADVLREIPAAVRFISAEPLLGSLYEGRDSRVASEEVRVPALQRGRGGDAALLGRPAAAGDDLGALPRSASDPRAAVPAAPAPVEGEPVRLDLPAAEVGRAPLDLTDIDWVIIGGESGPRARPFRLQHAREIIRARNARVWRNPPAIFVKQLGARPVEMGPTLPDGSFQRAPRWLSLRDRKGGDPSEWPADLRIREFPAGRLQAVAS